MDAIGHVDCDCFYVSAERVRYPHLRGVPVGVLGNQGACVIAKSYEMKAAGVATATAIWEAAKICPQAVYVKRDFAWYEVLSRKMLSLLRTVSPTVEYYSIDEMFFEAVEPTREFAHHLQQRVLHEVGVPASVGIARTKTLAKLASDAHKPLGCCVAITDDAVARLLVGTPVTEITGVARRSARKLAGHGITTCDQFVAADRRLIRQLLTKRGEDLWWELRGTPVIPIQTMRPEHKFISRGGSIGAATCDARRVQAFIVRNTERLVEALDYHNFACETFLLRLQFKGGDWAADRMTLPEATADYELLLEAALKLLPRLWPRRVAVHYMHLVAGRLTGHRRRQRGLFILGDARHQAIADVKRQINTAIGRFALRSAATLPLVDVYGDESNAYDICDVYGKSCF